jgi:hypothetical protein
MCVSSSPNVHYPLDLHWLSSSSTPSTFSHPLTPRFGIGFCLSIPFSHLLGRYTPQTDGRYTTPNFTPCRIGFFRMQYIPLNSSVLKTNNTRETDRWGTNGATTQGMEGSAQGKRKHVDSSDVTKGQDGENGYPSRSPVRGLWLAKRYIRRNL